MPPKRFKRKNGTGTPHGNVQQLIHISILVNCLQFVFTFSLQQPYSVPLERENYLFPSAKLPNAFACSYTF